MSSMKKIVSLRKVSSLEKYAVLAIKIHCKSYTILFFKGLTDKNLAASCKKVLWTFYQMKHLVSMLTSQRCSFAKKLPFEWLHLQVSNTKKKRSDEYGRMSNHNKNGCWHKHDNSPCPMFLLIHWLIKYAFIN